MNLQDILYLLAFFALAGITAVAFYIYGQFIDRCGHGKKQKLLVNSLSSHKRLTEELKHETTVHRRIADEYRDAYDKKEEYWCSVKKRWQDEAEKAKQIIAQQEELRTKHAISLKEANRKLMTMENEYQKTKRDNLAKINTLRSNQGEPEKLDELESKAAEVDKKYTKEIELKKAKILELQANHKKREEKLSKLENIILKKNNDINDLKTKIKQNGELESKLTAANASLTEKEKRYEAVKLDLKTRNESLTELETRLQESAVKVDNLEKQAAKGNEVDEIKKTMFIKETQLVEKESAMKKLAKDLDQKQHQVGLLQTDLNARNQKLTALVSQMEDTSELDEAMKKIGMLTSDAKGRDEKIINLKEQLKDVEMVFEAQKKHVSEVKDQGVLKDSTIEKLKKDLDDKSSKLKALQVQIKELEKALVKKDSDINSLNKQLKDTAKIDQLGAKIKEFEVQLKAREEEINKLVDESKDKNAKIEELEKLLAEKENKFKEVSAKLADTSERDALTQRLSVMQSQLTEKDSILAKAKEEAKSEEKKVVKLVEDSKKPEAELSNLKKQLAAKERELEKLDQKNVAYESKIESLETLISEKETDLESQKEALSDMETQLEDKSELEKLAKQLEALKATNDHQQSLIAEHHTVVNEEKEQRDILQEQLGEKDSQIHKLQDDLQVIRAQKTKDLNELNALRKQTKDTSEKDALTTDLKKTSEELSTKQKQLNESHDANVARQKRIEELERGLGERDAKTVKLNDRVKGLEHDMQESSKQIVNLKAQLENNSEVEDVKQKLGFFQTDLSKKEGAISNLNNRLKERESNISKLENLLSDRDAKLTSFKDVQDELTEKKRTFSLLHNDYQSSVEKLKDLEKHNVGKQHRINELEGYLNDTHAELNELKTRLQDTAKIDGLAAELERKKSELKSRNKEANKFQAELNKKVKQLDESHAEVLRLGKELENTSELDGLKSDLQEKEAKLGELQSQVDKQGAELEKSKGYSAELGHTKKELGLKIKQLDESHTELGSLRQKLENTAEVDKLKVDMKSRETKLKELQTQFDTQAKTLEKSKGLGAELGHAKKQLDESYAELERLRNELKNTSEIDAVKLALNEKEAEVKTLQSQIDNQGDELKSLHAKVIDSGEIDQLKSELVESQQSLQALIDEKSKLAEKEELVARNLVESNLEIERLRKELAGTSKIDTTKLDKLNKEITNKQERIDLLLAENKSKHERLVDLEKTTIHQSDELLTLQQTLANTSEADQLKEDINQRDLVLNSIRQEVEVAQMRAQELEKQRNTHLAEITELRAEVNKASQKLADTSDLDDLKNQLDHKIGFINTLSNQTSEKENKISELEKALANSQNEIENLRNLADDSSEVDKIREALNYKTVELNKLTHLMEKKDEILNELEAALNHAKSELLTIKSSINDTSEIDGLKDQLSSKNKQLDDIHKENVIHQDEIATLKASIKQTQKELERAISKANDRSEVTLLKEKLEERESRVKFLSDKTSTTATRLEELEKHVEARDAEISKLQVKLEDTSKLEKVISELEDKEALVAKLSAESTKRQDRVSKLEQALSELETGHAGKDEEIVSLKAQISELTKQTMLASFGAGVEQDSDKGVIYIKAPKNKDNLGDIFGVSEDLHSQLNKQGIYKHKQIALWSDRQVDHFQEELNFDGNIKREQWIIQAQRLTE